MTDGTGKRLQLEGYTSAGKTGTTEMLVDVPLANGRTVKRYSKSNHIGSFVCWAPAEPGRTPALVALVVVEDPQENGHYGSQTAGPVVQDVLQFGLEYLNVPTSYETSASTDGGTAAVRHRMNRLLLNFVTSGWAQVNAAQPTPGVSFDGKMANDPTVICRR